MDKLPTSPILDFYNDTLQIVRKEYDLDKPGQMDKSINILEEWVAKQKHFVKKKYDRDYLERIIIFSKGSVERAKRKLDKMSTFKTLLPKFFIHDLNQRRMWGDEIVDGLLPKLTKDHHRVYLLRNTEKKIDKPYLSYFQFLIAMSEYAYLYDYSKGFTFVFDYQHANIKEMTFNLNTEELRQAIAIIMAGYEVRVKGIHILCSSKFVSLIVTLLKQVLSSKVGERIFVHKSVEELYEHLPKDILPIEYGGNEKPLVKIHDELYKAIMADDFNKYLQESYKAGTKEEFRSKDNFNEEYLGTVGTFRTLCVD